MENNKKIKPNSYYSIQYWMINELGLKGLELSIYAIIYGFSRDHCGAFTGSCSYLADFTNSTKAGVDKALKSLIQKNLLEKKDFVNHGIKNCIYIAKEVANLVSYQSTELGGVANSVIQGSQLSCPNNIEDNIEDNTLSLEVKHFGLYGNVILMMNCMIDCLLNLKNMQMNISIDWIHILKCINFTNSILHMLLISSLSRSLTCFEETGMWRCRQCL